MHDVLDEAGPRSGVVASGEDWIGRSLRQVRDGERPIQRTIFGQIPSSEPVVGISESVAVANCHVCGPNRQHHAQRSIGTASSGAAQQVKKDDHWSR